MSWSSSLGVGRGVNTSPQKVVLRNVSKPKIFCLPVSYKSLKIKIYKTVMPAVLYGCETWSLTLREEHGLRVFERRIFGPKREEDGSW